MHDGLNAASKLTLLLVFILFPGASFAAGEMFKGTLIPVPYSESIPIVLEIENTYGRLSGSMKMSAPFSGEGRIIHGDKIGNSCKLTIETDIGMLRLEGDCLSTSFDGNYIIYSGRDRRAGIFRLSRIQPDKAKRELSESERWRASAASTTACLRENAACFAACPRGNSDTEFFCANGCTAKLAACKAKGKKSFENAPATID